MMPIGTVAITCFLYIGFLFAVAYFAEKRREAGKSIVSNSYIYSLSLALHFTSWTFYGVVGRAATSGIGFVAAYLGATLMAFIWWFLLRKMVRVSKEQNILSIADFISSRYGKSALLGGIITIFTVVGIMPLVALQIKAIAYAFNILTTTPLDVAAGSKNVITTPHFSVDTAIIVALLLSLFSVMFGAKQLDASKRHEGLVAAIAMQSVVKLIAFLSVGLYVTYGLFDGVADIFTRFAVQFPDRSYLFQLGTPQFSYGMWISWLFFSMTTVMFHPRQFHIMVIENSNEEHIKNAMWCYPVYAFLITLFVVPIALGGVIISGGDTAAADFFIINLPLRTGHSWLAMLVFIGGFSASAGMVIVESVVISTMILNHLVMPVILKLRIDYSDMSGVLVTIKRMGIITVVFLGYLYYRFIGESYTLTNIGFAAFVATSQFAPAVVGGLYWKRATRIGAITGLLLGFVFWFYTILIPLFVRSGWMESNILDKGLFGLAILRPLELFGLSGFEMLPHSLFWTLFFNLGAFIGISLLTDPDKNEAEQAIKFVDVFKVREEPFPRERMIKAPAIVEFVDLMTKFIGEKEAQAAIAEYLGDKQIDERGSLSEYELPILKRYTEKVLAGSVGAASAGIIIESYMAARGSELEEVFDIFGSVTLGRTTSREQLGVLYEAARVVASGADLKTIQDNILDLLRQQFKLDLCMIRMLDEERKVLTVRSQKGTFWWDPKESERGLTMESYAGAAFLTNSEVVVNDVDLMDKPSSIRFAHLKGIKSFAHAPITIEGTPIGVLSAYSESARGMFTDEFKELFTMLAGQIGVAWRNASQTEKLIEAKKREQELQIARTIQLGLLPHRAPDVAGIAIAGRCVPASEVGGDYYDFLLRDDKALDLVIADVSGHNIGAALIMAEARTFIQSIAKNRLRPKEVLSALNEFLYEDLTRAEFFISMFYLKFDCDCHELFFASAGHNPPLVWKRSSQSCFWLDAEGLLLGVKKEVNFEEKQMSLQSGDILMLYTDGITEAADRTGAFFGEHRLRTMLGESCQLSPQEIIDKLFREVRAFTGLQNFDDDLTIVVMKVD